MSKGQAKQEESGFDFGVYMFLVIVTLVVAWGVFTVGQLVYGLLVTNPISDAESRMNQKIEYVMAREHEDCIDNYYLQIQVDGMQKSTLSDEQTNTGLVLGSGPVCSYELP